MSRPTRNLLPWALWLAATVACGCSSSNTKGRADQLEEAVLYFDLLGDQGKGDTVPVDSGGKDQPGDSNGKEDVKLDLADQATPDGNDASQDGTGDTAADSAPEDVADDNLQDVVQDLTQGDQAQQDGTPQELADQTTQPDTHADGITDVTEPSDADPDTTAETCGNGSCGLAENCETCPSDCGCGPGAVCVWPGSCCVLACGGVECGDDGCGGSCGTCPGGTTCLGGLCLCAPDCTGKVCGDNGCGGSCGSCQPGWVCQNTACVCQPACGGKQCGDDGCGGSCGSCPQGQTCQNAQCQFAGTCQPIPLPEDPGTSPLPAMQPPGQVETISGAFTDDYLYDGTGYLKVGVRRNWGASMVFFGMAEAGAGMNNSNAIDANDTGREVQVALYDPERIMQGCAWNATCQTNPGASCPNSITYLGWNPVQGGNRCNIGSALESSTVAPGVLQAVVRPKHWNPNWEFPDCTSSGCNDPVLKVLESDVRYTQTLRFVATHIVEMSMRVDNLSNVERKVTLQEFPTLYAVWGSGKTANLRRIMDSAGNDIPVDIPANDGFFYRNFDSPGAWVTLQNDNLTYGVGIYYENRLTQYQAWQKEGVFNNVRSQFSFGLPALGSVTARAYLVLGAYGTIAGQVAWLDASLPPFGALDSPSSDQALEGSVNVSGWVLDNKGVATVKLLVDGSTYADLPLNTQRPDVCKANPGYSMCSQVGFSSVVSVAGLTPCSHLFEVLATDTDGNSRIIARRRVNVGDYQPPAAVHTVYRFYWSQGSDSDHMHSKATTPPAGYVLEGATFALFSDPLPGLSPLYQTWCEACKDYMPTLTANEGSPDYGSPEVLGYCSPSQTSLAPRELRRLYNPSTGDHFMSNSPQEWAEVQLSGWIVEGGCYGPE